MMGLLDTGRYNQAINQYDQIIQSIIAGNQTGDKLFIYISNIGCTTDVSPNMYPASTANYKPVHAIDASWNQTTQAVAAPPQGQTIYGEPIDAYCTDNPNAPAYNLQNTPHGGSQPLGGV